jgi:hypothetical protein
MIGDAMTSGELRTVWLHVIRWDFPAQHHPDTPFFRKMPTRLSSDVLGM